MAAKLGHRVERALAASRASPNARAKIEIWLERLLAWNERMDLTAARSPDDLVDLALADALLLAQKVPPEKRVVDVGTGAGAPGLALAFLRDDLRVTLIEPSRKRTSFLRTVLGATDRVDVEVLAARGETMVGRRTWEVAISRATMPPAGWLNLGARLAEPGGSVWVLLARDAPPSHPRARVQEDLTYTWPLTGAARRAVSYAVVP
jgi:16S rRNA (guanine527-N7)-methyltransferase